jgi:hypothetical protein
LSQHVTMMAAAKAGIKVVDIDTSLTDIKDIREWLKASQCKTIYFNLETSEQDTMLLLRKAIPEFFDCKSIDIPHAVFYRTSAPNLSCFAGR